MIYKKIKMLICIILSLALTSCGSVSDNQDTNKSVSKKYKENGNEIVFKDFEEKLGDNIPIVRGEVAKIVALTFSNKDEIENVTETIDFSDVEDDNVYLKYIDVCANKGYMKGDGKEFRPYDKITLKEASDLLEVLNPDGKTKLDVTEENINKPISYGLWSDLFIKTIDELSGGNVYQKFKLTNITPIVLATNKDNGELLDYIITDNGKLRGVNLDLSYYRDTEISLYEKDGEIVILKNLVTKTPTIENAYLYNYTGETATIFAGGVYREYKIINGKANVISGGICNIKVNGDVAQSISIYKESAVAKVRLIDEKGIKLSNNKSYTFNENFKIYGDYANTLTFESKKDIRVGSTLKFIVKKNEILAGVFEEETYPKRIRVILNDTSYSNTLHKSVSIKSTNGFVINDKTYGKDENVIIDASNYKEFIKDDFVEIKPIDNGMIIVDSIKRANNYSPKYRGIIEVCKVNGGFNVISDVSMDEYLYQVVPSEMPSSYGEPASQVQAICARTYAYKQYYKGAYEKFGANVDDSTSCQVYNNIPDNEISVNAVNATTNKVITYDNKVIDAFFFSTSGGTTASSGDVWTTNIKNFPSSSTSYLTSTKEHSEGDIDLTKEENAYKFFKDTNVDAYEKDVNWFRWNFTLQRDELSTSINNKLQERYTKRPELIQTLQADGSYKSVPIDSVGLVKDINVVKRGDGGNVIILEIIGTEKTIRVYTEYNVRALIAPYQYINGREKIVLNMVGESMKNYSLMPSSFFTMEKTYDENKLIKSITFYGGGNGHSVGLSQNGARELLERGMTIEEVIEHYYSGAVVSNIGEF